VAGMGEEKWAHFFDGKPETSHVTGLGEGGIIIIIIIIIIINMLLKGIE
jgi:hypothetical protein